MIFEIDRIDFTINFFNLNSSNKLNSVFNLVKEVNVLDSNDSANLAVLKRPELGITFTKLHCWNLTRYDKCVFLDADVLVSGMLI